LAEEEGGRGQSEKKKRKHSEPDVQEPEKKGRMANRRLPCITATVLTHVSNSVVIHIDSTREEGMSAPSLQVAFVPVHKKHFALGN
jgi:hypothetical protein